MNIPQASSIRPLKNKLYSDEELGIIAGFAVQYDVFVITDEVYEHIVYELYSHIYISSLPGMFERTISCSSLCKKYSNVGCRIESTGKHSP